MSRLLLPTVFLPLLFSCTLRTGNGGLPPEELKSPHGEQLWFAYGALSGTGGAIANGVAQARYYEDGTYVLNMQLNIDPITSDPKAYPSQEAWIFTVEGKEKAVGELKNSLGDTRHFLQYQTTEDLRAYTRVEIRYAMKGIIAFGTLKKP